MVFLYGKSLRDMKPAKKDMAIMTTTHKYPPRMFLSMEKAYRELKKCQRDDVLFHHQLAHTWTRMVQMHAQSTWKIVRYRGIDSGRQDSEHAH